MVHAMLGRISAALICVCAAAPAAAEPVSCGQTLYQDNPVVGAGFSGSTSHHAVGGPVLAEDFIPVASGRIHCIDWWGTQATSSSWELTLHFGNFGPSPLAIPALTGGFKLFVNAVGDDSNHDGIFWYSVKIDDPDWSVFAGQHYWFSAANVDAGWQWALADGIPEVGGQLFNGVQSVGAVACPDGGPHCGPWVPQNNEQYAFMLQVPEPAALSLVGAALFALAASRRRRPVLPVS